LFLQSPVMQAVLRVTSQQSTQGQHMEKAYFVSHVRSLKLVAAPHKKSHEALCFHYR